MTTEPNPGSLPRQPRPDLLALASQIQRRQASASALLEECLAQAQRPAAQGVYLRRFDDLARATARGVDEGLQAGAPLPRLAGLAVSVKDLFDVAGQPTTGGARVLAGAAPAEADSVCVARLRAAGAALTGHTNLSEFAFSGVGINPHHGTPANAGTAALDPLPRIPGGSTSGGAVSVACGAAHAALGSDTGGSIRIPAALQGLVGFKNTQRLTSNDGVLPLSTTLDTACAITLSVRDAIALHEVLAARSVALPRRAPGQWRLGVPHQGGLLDDLEPAVARAFDTALARLRQAGMAVEEVNLPALDELPSLLAHGTFAAAESWAWHEPLLRSRGAEYDPRVAQRIRMGEAMSATQYIRLHQARRRWQAAMAEAMAGFDALLSPTVPMLAPPIAPLLADDNAFFHVNRLLLRNPSVVNFLDGCAVSLPCQGPGDMPVGLMVWAGAGQDDTVLALSLLAEQALAS